jgi:hypothetical protein
MNSVMDTGIIMNQADIPDLAEMLGKIPDDDRLCFLRDTFTARASRLARDSDPESAAWAALYHYLVASIEQALLERGTGIQL